MHGLQQKAQQQSSQQSAKPACGGMRSRFRIAARTVQTTPNMMKEDAAMHTSAALEASGWLPGPVATEILPAAPFYKAEEGHQDYAERNSLRYKYYRFSCGRDARVAKVWAKAPPLTAAE